MKVEKTVCDQCRKECPDSMPVTFNSKAMDICGIRCWSEWTAALPLNYPGQEIRITIRMRDTKSKLEILDNIRKEGGA